jgi:hypothetical protein
MLWIGLAILELASPGIDAPLVDWIERSANRTGPAYMIAYEYIFRVLVIIFWLGMAALILAGFLQWRENRIRRRIVQRHCPACGYQIAPGVGNKCSECGNVWPH